MYLYENTLLNTVLEKVASVRLYTGVERLYKKIENFDYRLKKIREIIPSHSPKFVFVHFLFPHPPYLLSEECKPIDFEIIRKTKEETSYIKQLECVNKTIKELVNEILSKSKRKTIIVIQSDEGPFLPKGYFRDEKYLENIGNDPYVVHGKIFNAFYFPNKDADGIVDYSSLKINDSSTPVNTFRFIFNYYFGTNLKILQDKSFVYQDVNHPYKFIDVTKRVK